MRRVLFGADILVNVSPGYQVNVSLSELVESDLCSTLPGELVASLFVFLVLCVAFDWLMQCCREVCEAGADGAGQDSAGAAAIRDSLRRQEDRHLLRHQAGSHCSNC